MILFWLLAGAMVCIAIAMVWIPLHRSVAAVESSTESQALVGFQQRLTELERDHQAGHIDRTLYERLRTELERQLLADTARTSSNPLSESDTPSSTAPPIPSARFAQVVATVAAIGVPLCGLLYYVVLYQGDVYQWMATQQRLDPLIKQVLAQSDRLPAEAVDDLPNFTRVLQHRLAQQGLQDTDGLYLLGRCYLALQQPQAALLALARAHQQDAQRLDIMLVYAQALILTEEGQLNPTSATLLNRVLQQQPKNERALLLFGLGALQSGAYVDAIQALQTLLALRPADGEGAQLLRQSIARAKAALAALQSADKTADAADKTADVKADATADANAAHRPDDDKQLATPLVEQEIVAVPGDTVTGPQLAVTVHLDPKLQIQLADHRTLFIYAKAVHGPPMPLAAIRQPVETFPVQVVLDDRQAMMPALTLSSASEVIVGARLSKAGDAMAQSGDWQGLSAPIALAAGLQTVTLTIDQPVP